MSLLYGMENASHDSNSKKFLGKNIFTNAFPLSLANYMHRERGLSIPVVTAYVENGLIKTRHVKTPWDKIINADPSTARWNFEHTYDEYRKYTRDTPNGSDVVVADKSGNHRSAFEIKLVVVPTSGSAHRKKEKQLCELVIRPASIEQLAFSIARSYGTGQRDELRRIIVNALKTPQDIVWSDQANMAEHKDKVIAAAEEIIRHGIDGQTPLVIVAEWRTLGQSPILDENAFDLFVLTDMTLLSLFTETAKADPSTKVGRPYRSVIWLLKSLFDYSAQDSLQFINVTNKLNYGLQSDKSAAFTNRATALLNSKEFLEPRVKREEIPNILTKKAFELLVPERRLDGALMIQNLINQQMKEAEAEIDQAVARGEDPTEVDLAD